MLSRQTIALDMHTLVLDIQFGRLVFRDKSILEKKNQFIALYLFLSLVNNWLMFERNQCNVKCRSQDDDADDDDNDVLTQ